MRTQINTNKITILSHAQALMHRCIERYIFWLGRDYAKARCWLVKANKLRQLSLKYQFEKKLK